jgi:hypothetical protein
MLHWIMALGRAESLCDALQLCSLYNLRSREAAIVAGSASDRGRPRCATLADPGSRGAALGKEDQAIMKDMSTALSQVVLDFEDAW